jgi:putative hydrolase of the HAD superfamily
MARYLELLGRTEDAAAFEAQRWALVERGFELYPDVSACLAAVRTAGLKLGVITNNESVHQRRKLATVGLADVFDAVIISGEVGFAKPDGAIFRHGCAAVGVAPGEALHVGDLLEVDARGAAGAGLRGVWLDRQGRDDGTVEDVSVISALDELSALLG